MSTQLLLRAEDKPNEHRSVLTPATAKALIDAGYTLEVEKCSQRIFPEAEFEAVGATIIPKDSWQDADRNKIILGLKELPTEPAELPHTHIHFAHVFKNQFHWQETLARYARGQGRVLDLEFLNDETGRRVAAFGFHAGFAGAALAIKAWSLQKRGLALGNIDAYTAGRGFYGSEEELIGQLRADIAAVPGEQPSVFVMGSAGRCGSGAVDLCRKVGLADDKIIGWDINETRNNPGPYKIIADQDIFINCIYLQAKIPPFVDLPTLNAPDRKLTVICDVSADNTNPNNPVPVYKETSTFLEPVLPVAGIETAAGQAPISVISIDHLPSLLPRESSESFSGLLLPHLLKLRSWREDPVWAGAEKVYNEKVAELPASLLSRSS